MIRHPNSPHNTEIAARLAAIAARQVEASARLREATAAMTAQARELVAMHMDRIEGLQAENRLALETLETRIAKAQAAVAALVAIRAKADHL